jgi:acetyltransferase-like isoleucine patch superfamily enzyme
LDKFKTFINSYRFPIHLIAAADIMVRKISVLFGTVRARLMFALLGCNVGPGLKVDGRLVVRTALKGVISIGSNFHVNARQLSNLVGLTGPSILCCYRDGRITIGDNSGMSASIIFSLSEIRIGNHVNLGGNVRIFDHDFHSLDAMDRRDPRLDVSNCRAEPIVIEDDVLIGANAIVLKGVHIGARSIIGAGSVVTLRQIPPDSVVAGNPARIVRSLPATPTDSKPTSP